MNRAREAGFTLVELTVALVAGLIVALGIVALSRAATRTFHEEMRSSAAEATLRIAVDRLRADLARGGYMSTGNIISDPRIAHAPGAINNVANVNPGMLGVLRLASLRLEEGATAANAANIAPLSAIQPTPLLPDAIEIGGNMTSAEQFEVESYQLVGNCNRLMLSSTSPSMYRVLSVDAPGAASATQAKELNNIFQPFAGHQFMVRLVDDTGNSQFVATCPGTTTTGFVNAKPYVDVDAVGTPLANASSTLTVSGLTQSASGKAIVNPVQIVRWELTDVLHEPAQYRNALGTQALAAAGTVDPNKYDLVRSFVDALGAVVPETTEVVAEYAVDLDFAFSVETGTANLPNIQSYQFDAAENAQAAANVSTVNNPRPQPQRIRSVRARVATRTALPDRRSNIPITTFPSQTQADGTFFYRYCLVAPCTTVDSVARWARVRTITTEVALPNQAESFYP